jgi:sugar-specific transcriptional regulator TrmB
MAITQTLKKLGLNDKEIKIYLTLLKQGGTKPSDLAKITQINRANLYHLAKGLISRGIIAEDLSSKTLSFVPLPPENLNKILEQEKRELKNKEELIKKAIAEISLITPGKAYPVPKIRFIEENNLEKYLLNNIVKWQKSILATDNTWWGFQDHSFVEHYENFIAETWKTKEWQSPNYKAQVITNVSKIETKIKDKYPQKRDIRYLPDVNFTATVWVCGDYLITINTKEHPFYLFEIHDQLLADNMRVMFKKLWSQAKE